MIRTISLLSLLLLTACDSATGPATAEVSVGDTYSATTLQLSSLGDAPRSYDYLANGASFDMTFTTRTAFQSSLFVPREALVASGETDDVDRDIDQDYTGTYTQHDGALSFTPDGFSDSFLTADGWTVSDDGRSIRYSDRDGEMSIAVELTRR